VHLIKVRWDLIWDVGDVIILEQRVRVFAILAMICVERLLQPEIVLAQVLSQPILHVTQQPPIMTTIKTNAKAQHPLKYSLKTQQANKNPTNFLY